ncbi:BbsJ [Azoarcus sp. CIB]|nr:MULTISPECIES: hypothetical protein [unclassified Azoarcus]ABK15667.1 BbsJ [Azoarcus sp. CIB]AKU14407.1 BbsJ [Azoarcus sp. CIB]
MYKQQLRQASVGNSAPAGISHHECPECGMTVAMGEYHPYAACLMVGGCHDSAMIREALMAVFEDGVKAAAEKCRNNGSTSIADMFESLMRSDAE